MEHTCVLGMASLFGLFKVLPSSHVASLVHILRIEENAGVWTSPLMVWTNALLVLNIIGMCL